MSEVSHTVFKGITNISQVQLLTELEYNLKYWLDWAFLKIGGWTDVDIPQVDVFSGNFHVLRYMHDNSYTNGQVWQAVRKDWVWEQNVNFDDNGTTRNPIDITSVLVDNVSVTSGYIIDYPNGRLIFDNAISTSATVHLSYSFRTVQTYVADTATWWREVQYSTLRADDIQFTQDDQTGDWSIGNHHRIQLPVVIVEAVPRGISEGYELGNGALRVLQDVLFHVIADTRHMRNKIMSILQLQNDRAIWLFDSDAVAAAQAFPLDYRGVRVNNNTYPDLVNEANGYRWKKCWFKNSTASDIETLNPRLHAGVVRTTCELIYGDIG